MRNARLDEAQAGIKIARRNQGKSSFIIMVGSIDPTISNVINSWHLMVKKCNGLNSRQWNIKQKLFFLWISQDTSILWELIEASPLSSEQCDVSNCHTLPQWREPIWKVFSTSAEWRSKKKPYHWCERIAESNQCSKLFTIFPGGSDGEESACNAGSLGLIPRSGRSTGKGNGYLFQILAWRIP